MKNNFELCIMALLDLNVFGYQMVLHNAQEKADEHTGCFLLILFGLFPLARCIFSRALQKLLNNLFLYF